MKIKKIRIVGDYDMFNNIKIKFNEYYNLDSNRRDIIKKNIEKQLKEIIGFNEFINDIDSIDLNIRIKNYEKIINYITILVYNIENTNYYLRGMNLNYDGLSIVFSEKISGEN